MMCVQQKANLTHPELMLNVPCSTTYCDAWRAAKCTQFFDAAAQELQIRGQCSSFSSGHQHSETQRRSPVDRKTVRQLSQVSADVSEGFCKGCSWEYCSAAVHCTPPNIKLRWSSLNLALSLLVATRPLKPPSCRRSC